jgi:hypothetical protein
MIKHVRIFQGSLELFLSLENVLHIDGQDIVSFNSRVMESFLKTASFEGGKCEFNLFVLLETMNFRV